MSTLGEYSYWLKTGEVEFSSEKILWDNMWKVETEVQSFSLYEGDTKNIINKNFLSVEEFSIDCVITSMYFRQFLVFLTAFQE